jgi:hypothetical protein
MQSVRRYLAVLAGLLVATSMTSISQTTPLPDYKSDPRLLKTKQFFEFFDSPAYFLAEDFLLAADRNGLDWRLLPSLAILESGGGKHYMNNNILGWASCRQKFPSVSAGIHHVAVRLAQSRLYRDKNLDGMLSTYNAIEDYPLRVKKLMDRLALARGGPAGRP